MPEESFQDNLLRMIGAVLYQLLIQQTATSMFGKSYQTLGVVEKANLEQLVFQSVASNFRAITPESLKSQAQQRPQVGFQTGPPDESK